MITPAEFRKFKNNLPQGVNLLAVSKGHSVKSIRNLASLGQVHFGESRLQEALPKLDQLSDLENLRWHFIGHLQSNKVRTVLRSFSVIHSVDSYNLAERISRIAVEEDLFPDLMCQVKFRDDPNKGGFDSEELFENWTHLARLPNLNFIGLMTIAPKGLSVKDRMTLFIECKDLVDQLGLSHCSMGMSSDWEEAMAAGSTWLRLGSILFGEKAN